MQSILLVIQIILSFFLITIILLQRSSNDGISGLGGGNNSLVSSKTASTILSKITIILAALFMVNSLILANLASNKNQESSIFDNKQIEQKLEKNVEPSAPLAE